jgi:hypothetical protein
VLRHRIDHLIYHHCRSRPAEVSEIELDGRIAAASGDQEVLHYLDESGRSLVAASSFQPLKLAAF